MERRPVFRVINECPFCEVCETEFLMMRGYSFGEKQESIINLHKAYLKNHKQAKVLEISSKSQMVIGKELSAFNLKTIYEGKKISVECAFQGSKVFEKGGPYTDLYMKPSIEAKKDRRLRESGKLIKFVYKNEEYPLEPKDFFYNWIYINALYGNEQLAQKVQMYDSFTDIEFNPQRSINCQARAVAIYVGLVRNSRINDALKSVHDFMRIVYNVNG